MQEVKGQHEYTFKDCEQIRTTWCVFYVAAALFCVLTRRLNSFVSRMSSVSLPCPKIFVCTTPSYMLSACAYEHTHAIFVQACVFAYWFMSGCVCYRWEITMVVIFIHLFDLFFLWLVIRMLFVGRTKEQPGEFLRLSSPICLVSVTVFGCRGKKKIAGKLPETWILLNSNCSLLSNWLRRGAYSSPLLLLLGVYINENSVYCKATQFDSITNCSPQNGHEVITSSEQFKH